MSKTNSKLKDSIGEMKPKENLVAKKAIPTPNATNLQGHDAYSIDNPFFKLLSLLNTSKLDTQYYRSKGETLNYLANLIKECAEKDLYLTCQCIVWSRALGEGMRTISHAAAVLIAPYLSGVEYAKRFYGPWNKEHKRGGVIYRPDDMAEILTGFFTLNSKTEQVFENGKLISTRETGTKLTNPMKKGFREALESFNTYQLLKYKSNLIDVINLVRPSSAKSNATVKVDISDDDYQVEKTLDAIMKGLPVKAGTWEVNQAEAGQIVAKAVKEGKLSEEEAKTVLSEAKADNWEELLDNGKLGILAALRNIRNILKNNPNNNTITKLSGLISNSEIIKKGKIFPYQIDMARTIILKEFGDGNSRTVLQALDRGYEDSIPNLAELLPGRNCIFLDLSGSMHAYGLGMDKAGSHLGWDRSNNPLSCASKASLIAATIAKATNCDVIIFGNYAQYANYDPSLGVFPLATYLGGKDLGGTNLASAWNLASSSGKQYDRVFILSDNECNRGNNYNSYTQYVEKVGNPYVYSVDLASYGTTVVAGPKVKYFYGYGFSMFEDIASSEFNPNHHMDKVKKVII